MNIRRLIAAAALAVLAFSAPVQAAQMWLCSPEPQSGARTIGGAGSSVPSGTLYQLNGRGCAPIAQADVGYFQSQGFLQPGPTFSVIYTTGVLTGTTSVQIATLPPGTYVTQIIVDNTVAAAITGGINIGTTASAADVVSAFAVAASLLAVIPDALILANSQILTTNKGVSTPLFATAVTAWNSANVTFTVVYGYY